MPIPLGILAAAGAGGAAIPGSFELISTSILSSTTTAVTFSSIPSTYKHLQIRFSAQRTGTAGNTFGVGVQFNGDGGANYGERTFGAGGSSITINTANYTTSRMTIGRDFIDQNGSQPNFGSGVVDILDYTSTSKFKNIRSLNGVSSGNVVSNISMSAGMWRNTAAINSITILSTGTEQMSIGSRFSLYGIKG